MREDVIVRKLIADGEGNGEERRFQLLTSYLMNLMKKAEPLEAARALRMISDLEVSMKKQVFVAEACSAQSDSYKELVADIEKQIIESRDKMAVAKTELAAARLVRRNRQEYDLLAKMIDEIPSRAESVRKLEEVKEELVQQQDRQCQLESKLAERRNHLHAFNIILSNFQKFLDDDDDEASVHNDGENDGSDKEGENDSQTSDV